jgi:hypothetical protein
MKPRVTILLDVRFKSQRRLRGSGAGNLFGTQHLHVVAVQVNNLKKQTLKPGFHLIGSRVETGRHSSYGSTEFNLHRPTMSSGRMRLSSSASTVPMQYGVERKMMTPWCSGYKFQRV